MTRHGDDDRRPPRTKKDPPLGEIFTSTFLHQDWKLPQGSHYQDFFDPSKPELRANLWSWPSFLLLNSPSHFAFVSKQLENARQPAFSHIFTP
jgi:hypothetical protein